MGSSQPCPHPKCSRSSKPGIKARACCVPADSLYETKWQEPRAAACALEMPCSSNSLGALLALPTDPQLPWALCVPLTRASGLSSLPSWNRPLGQLSPPPRLLCKTWALASFCQELIPPVGFSLTSAKWVGGGEGKASHLFKTKAKKLNLLLGKSSPPGTGFTVPRSGKKSKCRNKSARLQRPGLRGRWPATGSQWCRAATAHSTGQDWRRG